MVDWVTEMAGSEIADKGEQLSLRKLRYGRQLVIVEPLAKLLLYGHFVLYSSQLDSRVRN